MHRKIRSVVTAESLERAVEKSKDGLQNAMNDQILADGTLSTLKGEYTPFSPSSYFSTDRDKAGYPVGTEEGEKILNEASRFTINRTNCFLYTIDRRDDELTATPVSTQKAVDYLESNLDRHDGTVWVVTFDLRYDFDANPHKSYEILDR